MSITIANTQSDNLGALMGYVTVQGTISPLTQIAQVVGPRIQPAMTHVAATNTGNRIEIHGSYFGSNKADIASVVFTPDIGTVTVVSCNDTFLVVDAADSSAANAGDLQAVVTHKTYGSTGLAVRVGTVTAAETRPTVMTDSANLESHSQYLTISGTSFGISVAGVKVYLTPKAGTTVVLAEAVNVEATKIKIRMTGLTDIHAGVLKAIVAVKGITSAEATVATVTAVMPVVTSASFKIAKNAAGNLIEISGSRFGSNPNALGVVFNPVLESPTVVTAKDTLIVVKVGDTSGVSDGIVAAVVSHSSYGSSAFGSVDPTGQVMIGAIVSPITVPFVQPSTANFERVVSGDIVIKGSGFGTAAGDIRVYLQNSAGEYLNPRHQHVATDGTYSGSYQPVTVAVKTSPAVSANAFTITASEMRSDNVGKLQAIVVVQGTAAALTQVAEVIPLTPVIWSNSSQLLHAAGGGSRVIVRGKHFGAVKGAVAVASNCGSPSVVSCNDTFLVFDCMMSTSPSEGDAITAIVTHSTYGASASMQVGTASKTGRLNKPIVTAATGSIKSSATVITIGGSEFGTSVEDTAVFVKPAAGSVVLAEVQSVSSIGSTGATIIQAKLTGLSDINVGALQVIVAVRGLKSDLTSVATVVPVMPIVTPATFKVARSAVGNLIEIRGSRFAGDCSQLHVMFNPQLNDVRVVTCSNTDLIVSVRDTSAVPLGPLKAIVIHQENGASAYATTDPAGEVTVATIVAASATPVVSPSTSNIPLGTQSIQIFVDLISSSPADLRVHMADNKGTLLDILTPITALVVPSGITFSIPADYIRQSLDKPGNARLHVVVSSFGVSSAAAVVGIFAESVEVKLNPGGLQVARSAIGNRIELHGTGFGGDCTMLAVAVKLVAGVGFKAGFVSGIHRCSDTLIIADLASTMGGAGYAAGDSITAVVTRTTEFAQVDSNMAVVGYFAAALTSVPVLSASAVQISSQSSGLSLHGGNFGADRDDMRVYLSSSSGAWFDAHIEDSNVTALRVEYDMQQTANRTLTDTGSVVAVVSVRGVLSNTATVAVESDQPVVAKSTLETRRVHSPISGNYSVVVHGASLQRNTAEAPVCRWDSAEGHLNTVGLAARDGSSVACPTPKGVVGALVRLSLVVPASTFAGGASSQAFKTGVTVDYHHTMLASDLGTNSVLFYHASTGALLGSFVQPGAGGLDGPWGIAFGAYGDLVVASSNNDRVLLFDGSTGAYKRVFCELPSPRGLAFHYGDLYVTSSRGGSVLRFNGGTGAPRGVLGASGLLQNPWGIVFNAVTNQSLVASQDHHHIIAINPPAAMLANNKVRSASTQAGGVKTHSVNTSAMQIWSKTSMHHVTGIDLTAKHVYAVSPYSSSIVQYNRTTGNYKARFGERDDSFLPEAFDVKAYNGSVFVCGEGGIQRWYEHPNQDMAPDKSLPYDLEREQGRHFVTHQGLRCSFLLVHQSHGDTRGK